MADFPSTESHDLPAGEPLPSFAATRAELERRHGPARVGGARPVWIIEPPCGLRIAVELDEMRGVASVRASEADPEHVLVHLQLPVPEPADGPRWELWRQDDNGNRARVARYASRAAAACRLADFEARGHKQTYWLEQA